MSELVYQECTYRAITREARVAALRALGYTFAAIGHVVGGVSGERVRQLLRLHEMRCRSMGRLSIPKRMRLEHV